MDLHPTDLFGRVPAWEPMVWGWSGVVVHYLARGFAAPANVVPP